MRDYVAEHSAGVKYGAFSVLFLNVTALGAALGLRGIHQVGCGEWVPECRLRSWKVKAAVMQPLFHTLDYDSKIVLKQIPAPCGQAAYDAWLDDNEALARRTQSLFARTTRALTAGGWRWKGWAFRWCLWHACLIVNLLTLTRHSSMPGSHPRPLAPMQEVPAPGGRSTCRASLTWTMLSGRAQKLPPGGWRP